MSGATADWRACTCSKRSGRPELINRSGRERKVDPGQAKLSLHYSGQSHVYYGPGETNRTPPLYGRPLNDPAGGHIASITSFDLAGLPLLGGSPNVVGPEIDVLAAAPGQGTSELKVTLHASSDRQAMNGFPIWLTLRRPVMPQPLYVGLHSASVPGQLRGGPGVQVIGGWGPGASQDAPASALGIGTGPDSALPSG